MKLLPLDEEESHLLILKGRKKKGCVWFQVNSTCFMAEISGISDLMTSFLLEVEAKLLFESERPGNKVMTNGK